MSDSLQDVVFQVQEVHHMGDQGEVEGCVFGVREELTATQVPNSELRERIAAIQHEIWSHWMIYLFKKCDYDIYGEYIPSRTASRWRRQALTKYDDLTEIEKESDREQADKILAEMERYSAEVMERISEITKGDRDEVEG